LQKFETLDSILKINKGFIKTSDAIHAGISKTYFAEYVLKQGLERVAHGLYMSQDAWEDSMYVLQTRYPGLIFSHETALYLLNHAEREPTQYAITLKTGTSSTYLNKQGIKVYKVNAGLFDEGLIEVPSPSGHKLRAYNFERTICDLFRSRKNIEYQDLQSAVKEYLRSKEKDIPLLLRCAGLFSVDKALRQYLEVLL
jgi:hypothetical protein